MRLTLHASKAVQQLQHHDTNEKLQW